MRFVTDISKEEYKAFSDKHEKSHFLQSYEWGQFCEKEKKQVAHYVGMKDDHEELVATALLMEKKTPLGYSYMYCPRGFLIDYTNKAHIKVFTNYLRGYMKDNKVIYIKFDPDIKYQDIDADANKVDGGENNYELFDYLIHLGYKHGGFYRLYDGNQPRYTFRINLKRPWEEIEKSFSKTFMQSVRRSEQYHLKFDNEVKPEMFYELIKNNGLKDDFDPHSKQYYINLSNELGERVKYYNVSIRPKELLQNIETSLEEQKELLKTATKKQADIQDKITRLEREKAEFSKIEEEELTVFSLICTYTDNRVWSFFVGNNDYANLTFAISKCYYEAIKESHEKGYDLFDLFGTIGDPKTSYKNLAKLHDFKRKFGDEYIEFIGEFDLINKKLLYKMLPTMLKIYRKLRG